MLAKQSGWDVHVAAQLLGISRRSLGRLCQRDLDCTPKEFFHRERMAHASELLVARQSIKAVALNLGYTRPANFSRDFKRHFGRTPRALVPRIFIGLPSFPPAADSGRAEK